MLRTLGLSAEGGRYECRDRLLTVLAAHVAVKQGNRTVLMQEVRRAPGPSVCLLACSPLATPPPSIPSPPYTHLPSTPPPHTHTNPLPPPHTYAHPPPPQLAKMTLRELRDELRMRGESDEGTKGDLERRLARAALIAAGHEAPSIGQEETAAAAAAVFTRQGVQILVDPFEEAALPVLRTEPAATVALLFGAPAFAPAAEAQLALESARTLADALQTAPLLGPAAWGPIGGEGQQQQQQQQQAGVMVEAYWVDPETGAAAQVPLAALYTLQAPDLAVQLPGVAAGSWAGAGELARHLKGRGVKGAVSALAAGGGAGAEALAAALKAAGVAVAGALAEGSAGGDRWRMLKQLKDAKFPVLPAMLLEPSDFAASKPGRPRKTAVQPDSGAGANPAAARAAATSALMTAAAAHIGKHGIAEPYQAEDDDGERLDIDDPADDPGVKAVVEKLRAWCGEAGVDEEFQTFALSAAGDTAADPLAHACGVVRAAVAARAMVESGASRSGWLGRELGLACEAASLRYASVNPASTNLHKLTTNTSAHLLIYRHPSPRRRPRGDPRAPPRPLPALAGRGAGRGLGRRPPGRARPRRGGAVPHAAGDHEAGGGPRRAGHAAGATSDLV